MTEALLDRDTIDRALAEADTGPILIALSGGGDSVALMHLLAEELGPARLRACIVDHALRPESANEALKAQGFAQALGITAEIATLHWDEPRPRSQAEARTRRYQALCAEARRIGARVIALGHTRDDQIETIFMRADSRSWRGMVGMPAYSSAPIWPEGRGLCIARPMLKTHREALRDALRVRHVTWVEDPSNANPKFRRVQTREFIREVTAEGHDLTIAATRAEELAPRMAKLDAEAQSLVANTAHFADDAIILDLAHWCGDIDTRRRALEVLIAAASGEDRQGAPRGLAGLEASMTKVDFPGATLGGARLKPVRGGIQLSRDTGAILGRADGKSPLAPLLLPRGQERVWDGRLALTAREPGWKVTHDDTARPLLVNETQTFALAEAEATGIVEFQWLLEAHVAHLLAAYRR